MTCHNNIINNVTPPPHSENKSALFQGPPPTHTHENIHLFKMSIWDDCSPLIGMKRIIWASSFRACASGPQCICVLAAQSSYPAPPLPYWLTAPVSLLQPSSATDLPRIDAIVLFGEPIRWETNLQLIIDVLLTGGYPASHHQAASYPHIPVLACNMDLMWMAEAHSPRFGHGTFMVCLENIYKKITGKELKYEVLMGKPSEVTYQYAEYLVRTQKQWAEPIRTLYAIGDNLMTDIYGANLYNRYLTERAPLIGSQALVQAASGVPVVSVSEEEEPSLESVLSFPSATSCRSILVCTGIYNPNSEVPADTSQSVTETVFHGHRDFRLDPALVEPGHIVADVSAAVDLIFQLEGFVQRPHD
ncbi:uncharacterized protein LOC100127323 isoform X1 [Xenopus laevis]|uniref:Uncharacterized protein LOC100127323 isoform X1 n=1 Tax=Xenopus laevis TaxID=8355 RepID=A0A8J1MYT6_XENLA|nr:uncharacterized protein LOC100127323 isoform X1 [Xenopus laevis]